MDDILSKFANAKKPQSIPEKFFDPGCGEKQEIELLLSKNMDELDKRTLTDIGAAWEYFDSKFVNYYLPGIILYTIQNPEEDFLIVEDILSELSYEYSVDGLTFVFRNKWEGLSAPQLKVVANWLDILKPHYSFYDFAKLKNVLLRLKPNQRTV